MICVWTHDIRRDHLNPIRLFHVPEHISQYIVNNPSLSADDHQLYVKGYLNSYIYFKSSPDLKLLGVTLDDELSFSARISDICKKASKKVGVLVRLRNMIPREAKLQLYKSAILPNKNL